MHALPNPGFLVDSSIAWFYLVANSLRGFTYLPQIFAVWRSRDGARSLSLLTWGSWLVAHVAAILYGLVLDDAFFTSISMINCAGCACVAGIAATRRRQWHAERHASLVRHPADAPSTSRARMPTAASTVADAYLARWGYSHRWVAASETPRRTECGSRVDGARAG